eukprot:TRINITY_DN33938_c0_g1_i1.p1 TRINITY_DN33938_c0_g1~~TRINITY_DN33938_c0_g1_i1.p1  ORF type:complete len:636 (+),score=138.93 TRINITY_DN33938_c0_g1_i1:40-1947(+)
MALPLVMGAEEMRTRSWEQLTGALKLPALPSSPHRKTCLCLAQCPWLEECCCHQPMDANSPQFSRSLSMSGYISRHDAMVARHVRDFLPPQASESSLARRAKFNSQRKMLGKTCSWGELQGLQAGIRSATLRLGVEDPKVKAASRMQSRAVALRRICRDTYLELQIPNFIESMASLQKAYYKDQSLKLGRGLYEDPFLSWAREAMEMWRQEEQRLAIDDLCRQHQMGPAAYCEAWTRIALDGSAEFLGLFGHAITDELTRLPDAGLELAAAMGRVLSERPVKPSSGAPVFETEWSQIQRLSSLLGLLDSQILDLTVMRPAANGRTSLDVAANLADNRAFCALTLPIFGETLVISSQLQAELAGSPNQAGLSPKRAAQMPNEPTLQRSGVKLCENLRLSPDRHLQSLGVRLLHDGGFRIRLQADMGQPSLAEALQAIGPGAIGTERRVAGEILRWAKATSLLKQVYAFPGRCRDALQVSTQADAQVEEAGAALDTAIQHTLDCTSYLTNTTSRRDELNVLLKEHEAAYMALMKQESELQKKAMRGDDEAEEQMDDLKVHMKEEKQKLNELRQEHAGCEQGIANGSVELEQAHASEAAAKVHLENSTAEAAAALSNCNDVVASYEALLHTSLSSMRE